MINPWIKWQRMVRAATMMSETLAASQQVVEQRHKTIEVALSDPLRADHAELGRMVSEKSAAFGAAGASLARDWVAMQAEWHAQAQAIGQIMMGRMPGPRATGAIVARSQRIGSAALASSIRAIRPVHRTATANAKRLAKRR
ncbi:MAG: hypothetical protein LH465_05840 [Sphingomonas bacterium]|nr:hypothetical protein [Sphingomonas bacterium]